MRTYLSLKISVLKHQLIYIIHTLLFIFRRFFYHFPNFKKKHFLALFYILRGCFQPSSLNLYNTSKLKKSVNQNNKFFDHFVSDQQFLLKKKNIMFSIIAPVFKSNIKFLNEMIDSIEAQSYDNWELILVDDFSNDDNLFRKINKRISKNNKINLYQIQKKTSIGYCTNFGINKARGEYIGLVDHDDLLEPHTLFLAAKEINKKPNLALIYTDEDKFDGSYFYDFQYKTDFDRSMLLTTNYINHFKIFKKTVCKKVGLFDPKITGVQDFDFLSRFVNQIKDDQVCHIPIICYHWRSHNESTAKSIKNKPYMLEQAKAIFQNNLNNLGLNANVFYPNFAIKNNLIYFNLKWKMRNAKVSIIIPNKNNHKLLKKCIDSLRETINNLKIHQILIVDDSSDDLETLKYYQFIIKDKTISCDILKTRFNEFNFSKMINHGVSKAKNEFILVLNNDITAINNGWLEQMMGWFELKNVAIVGPKLLFPNNKIQHAGVMIGPHYGLADHYFYNLKKDSNTYLNFLNLQRNVSAVTGACFLTKKSIFKKVRGMDDELFKVSYSDIDFCLRIKEKKFNIIYDNTVELYHLTSASRGSFVNPAEHHNFIRKYQDYKDPFINPNIDINSTNLDINHERFKYIDYIHNNLHLAFFTHNLDIGGAPLLVFDFVKKLVKYGYKVTVISAKKGQLEKNFKSLKNVRLIIKEIDIVAPCSNLESMIEKYFQGLNEVFERSTPDIIYANTMLSYPAVLYARRYGLLSRWLIHEEYSVPELVVNFNGQKGLKLIREAFKFCSKVVYESQYLSKYYKFFHKKNYEVRQGGIDFREIDFDKKNKSKKKVMHIRSELNIPLQNKVFLNVGTICERKNQFEIVKAIALIPKNIRELFSVALVGDIDLDYSKKIKKFITENGLKNVHVLKNQNNINDYYSMSDFYISSTNSESFPRALLTAMAFELPIISSIYNGIFEILYDKNYATFYKKNNSIDLSKKIIDFLEKNTSIINHKAGLSLSLVMRIYNLDRVILNEINSINKMYYG